MIMSFATSSLCSTIGNSTLPVSVAYNAGTLPCMNVPCTLPKADTYNPTCSQAETANAECTGYLLKPVYSVRGARHYTISRLQQFTVHCSGCLIQRQQKLATPQNLLLRDDISYQPRS